MSERFAVSEQHYLFGVQAFADIVLKESRSDYEVALRDRTTRGVIADVASGVSDLGVIFQTSTKRFDLDSAIEEAGLEFVELVESIPVVALPAAHPLVGEKSVTLEQIADFPYVYFEQEDDNPAFAEEALADIPRTRCIATTDRASLSEIIAAVNGYTITSGILVGITDGSLLNTVPLKSDVRLKLGYLIRKGTKPEGLAARFVSVLNEKLKKYART